MLGDRAGLRVWWEEGGRHSGVHLQGLLRQARVGQRLLRWQNVRTHGSADHGDADENAHDGPDDGDPHGRPHRPHGGAHPRRKMLQNVLERSLRDTRQVNSDLISRLSLTPSTSLNIAQVGSDAVLAAKLTRTHGGNGGRGGGKLKHKFFDSCGPATTWRKPAPRRGERPRRTSKEDFVVQHYAGPVIYTVGEWTRTRH